MALEFGNFNFISVDKTGDCVLILKQEDGISVSTQNKNSERVGTITVLELDEVKRLRDWLNREFPNA